MQWRVAELQPPHLKALYIDEGWTDIYREVVCPITCFFLTKVHHGGIPDSHFWPHLAYSWGRAIEDLEDLATETKEHPYFDDFWKTKASDFSKIVTPAYIVCPLKRLI
jgi:predicted acyl esterase